MKFPLNLNYDGKIIREMSLLFGLIVTVDILTHCGLGDFNEILDEYFSSQLQWLMVEIPAVKLPLEECH